MKVTFDLLAVSHPIQTLPPPLDRERLQRSAFLLRTRGTRIRSQDLCVNVPTVCGV